MKKLIALSILVSLFAVGVFAQEAEGAKADAKPPITGSAEAALVPLQIDHSDGDTYIGAGLGRPQDPEGPMVKLAADMNFFESKVGAKVELQFYYNQTGGQNFAIGDFAELWFQPTDWFKMDVGRFNEDYLRGKVGDDNWSSWTVAMGGKDNIFTRFKGVAGALLAFRPSQVKGLYIGVMAPSFAQFKGDPFKPADSGANDNSDGSEWRAYRVYERIQAAVGYELEGTGLVRAQFVGANPGITGVDPGAPGFTSWIDLNNPYQSALLDVDKKFSAPRFEGAFAYTGMTDLVVDFGFKIYLPISDWTTDTYNGDKYTSLEKTPSFWNPIYVSLGASYQMGDIGIAARLDLNFLGSVTYDAIPGAKLEIGLPFGLNFHLWPSYKLGDIGTVGLDFGLAYIGKTSVAFNDVERPEDDKEGGINVGFGLWFKKSFGNSSVKLGAAYRVGTEIDGAKQPGVLSIPIVFDYSF